MMAFLEVYRDGTQLISVIGFTGEFIGLGLED
jgi:hypothetical protein